MPDLANRLLYEKRIADALKPIFLDQFRRVAKNPVNADWEQFEIELRSQFGHQLAHVFLVAATEMLQQQRIKNATGATYLEAQRWAEIAAVKLAAEVVSKSRELVEQALRKADDRNALGAMLILILASTSRLDTIATTETTRAISAGERFVSKVHANRALLGEMLGEPGDVVHKPDEEQEMLKVRPPGWAKHHRRPTSEELEAYAAAREGATLVSVWVTARDAKVCFPAGTKVDVPSGEAEIQRVRPGDLVMTRKGARPVRAVSCHQYNGRLVQIEAGGNVVSATDEHPFWTSEQGWVDAGHLNSGLRLKTFTDQQVKISGIRYFRVGQPQYIPPPVVQILGFSGVSLGVLVPIRAINFDSDGLLTKKKVDAISPEPGFLNKINLQLRQCLPDLGFGDRLSYRSTVASERTELPVCRRRYDPEFDATRLAVDMLWRSAASFGTVVAIQTPLSMEHFSATFARNVLGKSMRTLCAAMCEAVRDTRPNLEVAFTAWADFRDHFWCAILPRALSGTKLLAASRPNRNKIELNTAFWTNAILAGTLAFLRSVFHNFRVHWHGAPFGSELPQTYHGTYSKSMAVHNLEVEGEPEFFANKLLVHNCKICAPLDGHSEKIWGAEFPEGPPAHPNCRCYLHWVPLHQLAFMLPAPVGAAVS